MKTTQQGADQRGDRVGVCVRACVCVCTSFGGGYSFADTREGIPRTALLITSGDHRARATACGTHVLLDIVSEIEFYNGC